MTSGPPYSMGIFETIVGVHFGDGLAVEFKPDGFPASYLTETKSLAGLNRGTIAFWFRVPSESFGSLLTTDDVLPLVTFGNSYTWYDYTSEVRDAANPPIITFDGPVTIPTSEGVSRTRIDSAVADPGYIGLKRDDHGNVRLVFNFQTDQRPVLTSFNLQVTEVHTIPALIPGTVDPNPEFTIAEEQKRILGSGYDQYAPFWDGLALGLASVFPEPDEGPPEQFLVETIVPITPDHWHILVVAFDFRSCKTHGSPLDPDEFPTVAEGTTTAGKLYYAIDTVDYRGSANMQPYFVEDGPDANSILTPNAYNITQLVTRYRYNLAVAPTTYSFTPKTIFPHGVAVPSNKGFSEHIEKVEMGELQIFRKVADTSKSSIMSLFVDKKGKPVTNYKAVDKALGAPVLRLHGSSKWIKGVATGSITALKPTGKIIKYVPDPSLFGPQSPDELKK